MDEEYYTIEEVAERLKVTRAAVYKWMRSGRLPYVLVGDRRRITSSALKAFIRQGKPEEMEDDEETLSPALVAA